MYLYKITYCFMKELKMNFTLLQLLQTSNCTYIKRTTDQYYTRKELSKSTSKTRIINYELYRWNGNVLLFGDLQNQWLLIIYSEVLQVLHYWLKIWYNFYFISFNYEFYLMMKTTVELRELLMIQILKYPICYYQVLVETNLKTVMNCVQWRLWYVCLQ